MILSGTDLCGECRFSQEAGSRWSAAVMDPETLGEELQLSFWDRNKY